MNNAIFSFAKPENEVVKQYAPGSTEREKIEETLRTLSSEPIEIPLIIGGKEVRTGDTREVVMPHNHAHVLAHCHQATEKEVQMAIDAALAARNEWESMPWMERSAILMRVAKLLSCKYRYLINAATMLGQSKTVYQAEIDSACESIDFLRYNAFFASEIYAKQPSSSPDQLNRMEYRALEGFVFSLTPFNFTAIASNLNMAPILMGNTTIWKPAHTASFSNYYLMKIFMEAGVPAGVINFLPGKGSLLGNKLLSHKYFAGIHFTGSSKTFNTLWKQIGNNIDSYVSYPKIVGETGGKDFIMVHASAQAKEVATAIVRGSFEFQGQKCSAASRVYLPKSLWHSIKSYIEEMVSQIRVGDVTDFKNFMSAVIDETSFDNIMNYINLAKQSPDCKIITGGTGDKSIGYFVQPTVIETTDPKFTTMCEEIFGPVVTVFVYEDARYEETLRLCDQTSPYALTGSIFANERAAVLQAMKILQYAAGNFYINDKPTGAVVGMQPFGGSRASGTNDKAGEYLNLLRWVNPRTIKETYQPDTKFGYPFME